MRNYILFLTLLLTISLSAQKLVIDSAFTSIKVYDGILLSLVKSDSLYFEISEGNRPLEDFKLDVEKNILTIRLAPDKRNGAEVRAKLHYKTLTDIKAFGKAELTTRNIIKTDSISIEMRSGAIGFIDLDVKSLNALILEGALLTCEGYAIDQHITSKTGATFSGFKLEGKTAKVLSGSGGKSKVNISDKAELKAKFRGYIGYKGNPKFADKKKFPLGQIVKDE